MRLCDQPECFDTVVSWLHNEWLKQPSQHKKHPAQAYAQRRIQFQEHLKPQALPTTFVAKTQRSGVSMAMGCVSLTRLSASRVLRSHTLTQGVWLSNLFVLPTARGSGMGGALLAAAQTEAARLGYREIFLYTHSAKAYYLNRGWRVQAVLPLGACAPVSSHHSMASQASGARNASLEGSVPSDVYVLRKKLL